MSTSPNPEQWECPKCGKVMHHRKCRGHSKRDGKHCGDWAAQGSDVCRRHGASAPQVKAAAQRRLAEAEARRATVTYGLPREVEPHQALLEELHRTAGIVAWLGDLIANLDHQETGLPRVGGDDEGDDEMPERSSSGLSGLKQYQREKGLLWEKPAVWVELYQSERKHLTDVAKACVAAGIEERRVRLAESQGQLLAQVIRGVLGELGVLDRPEVPQVVRRHLELVAGEAA